MGKNAKVKSAKRMTVKELTDSIAYYSQGNIFQTYEEADFRQKIVKRFIKELKDRAKGL